MSAEGFTAEEVRSFRRRGIKVVDHEAADRRAADLHREGWRGIVLDRYGRALRRAGLKMRRVDGRAGPVWYAPGWAVELAEGLEVDFLSMAVERAARGLDPDAMLASYRLGGAPALQALLLDFYPGPA